MTSTPEPRNPDSIPPRLVAEADQLAAQDRERGDAIMAIAEEAVKAPEPPEGAEFWSA